MKRVDRDRQVREVIGVILFALGLFLLLALISYDPRDLAVLKKGLTSPQPVVNLVGKAGALISELLFFTLGVGALLLPLISFFYALRLFFEAGFRFKVVELLGFMTFTIVLSSLLALKYKYISLFGSEISAGGLAGVLAYYLRNIFNLMGSYIVLVSLLIISAVATGLFSLRWLGRALKRPSGGPALPKRPPQPPAPQIRDRPLPMDAGAQVAFPFASRDGEFTLPPLSLLDPVPRPSSGEASIDKEALLRDSHLLEKKLADFGVEGKVTEVRPGPVVTLFEFVPAPGMKISRIVGLSDDLALALRGMTVRVVAPIPGKSAVGIEVPNLVRQTVYLREVLSSPQFLEDPSRLKLALGKEMSGYPFVTSLIGMPHLLVAGSTGTGKSIFINSSIISLLFQADPSEVKFIMIDPKRLELTPYEGIPHLLMPVIFDPRRAASALRWAVEEMERRYELLTERGAKNIESYNQMGRLPYIVIFIDELADLMMTAAREVEGSLTRLAQMARAAGIHLVVATQRPSVDVLTGLIKNNFPARISFQVPSRVDSRTILDISGAEQLLGKGDMLFLPPGSAQPIRIHGCYVSEAEIKRVAEFLKRQGTPSYIKGLPEEVGGERATQGEEPVDEKYQEAVELVMRTGQVSISMIQRHLRIGFNRAARIIERMEEEGIVSRPEPGKPREILRGER